MAHIKILIGRSHNCDYVISNPDQHPMVSGEHAHLSETDSPGVFLYEDHSTNGSYINGQFVHNGSCTVRGGDHITLGRTFVLPLDDILRRYFASKPTVDRKRPQPAPQPVAPQPAKPNDIETEPVIIPAPQPEPIIQTVTKIEEVVPAWFWGLYVVSIIIAFFAGMLFM